VDSERTARDRLRDAAVDCFAAQGFGATVRDIAAHAGVTAGLITHHFGSKDALRAACDDEVLRRIRELKEDGIRRPPEQQIAMIGELDEQGATLAYALRLVRGGGPAARAFLRREIEDATQYMTDAVRAGILKPSRDEAARARYLVTAQFGGMLLQADLLGLDLADSRTLVRELTKRTSLAALEVYTGGLLTDRSLLDRYLAAYGDPIPDKEQE